jgi:hypothetical protein
MGCTVVPITQFPYDGGLAYTDKLIENLTAQIKDLKPRSCVGAAWIAVVNNNQKAAKKALEAAGFEELGRVFSCHDTSAARQKDWIDKGMTEGEMCYLMGKGFYHPPKVAGKKEAL